MCKQANQKVGNVKIELEKKAWVLLEIYGDLCRIVGKKTISQEA